MGKTKGKIKSCEPSTGNGVLIVRGNEYPFNQPFSVEIGLQTGMEISCTLADVGTSKVATNVLPSCNGEIVQIDLVKGVGTLVDTDSGIKYPFVQMYCEALNLKQGSLVSYIIVYSAGTYYATCLE